MKRRMKKLMSLLISVSMVFSVFTMPVYATPADGTESEQTVESETIETEDNTTDVSEVAQPEEEQPETAQPEETQPQTTTVEESFTTYTVNADDIDVSEVTPYSVSVEEEVQVDENDPVMTTVEEELGEIKVLNDDGEAVPLTEEQIQQVLYVYGQYQDQWKANANLLGVQQPFFLSYNDNEEDGLGALGEMLVLAGYSVQDVRDGKYKFDDLMGMIQNFLYADKFALEFYSDAIAESRDAALAKVEESGAKNLVQKMLVINDWIAHNTNFDMAYIMQDEDGNPIMVAENPQKHEHYDEIYDEMYDLYYDQIEQQFHDQIYDSIVAQFRQQYYEGAIKNIIYQQALGKDEAEATDEEKAAAEETAEAYMEENADAISEDADAFVRENFGDEAGDQISAGADEFIADAEENGVEVDPENAPGYKMTIEEITQNTMENEAILDLDGDGENETTANQAIPIYADQAATGLTNGIIGAWEGNHVGVLAEGVGVCAGYSKAFSYLLQYMSPEIYGTSKDADMSVAENWKTPEELYYDDDGNLDITKDYLVDMVRITFDANVTMFGEESPFGEVHFWNAVQVDGKWYYVDSCYTDIYVECMSRDRVEIDGTMNYMYFMFSHSTATEMYDGNMKEIASLYSEVATDTSYEDSWYARVSSNAYSDGSNFYYMYDSSDMLGMMREFQNLQNSTEDSDFNEEDFAALMEGSDPAYKLVYHPITDNDIKEGGADSDFTTLINFNPKDEDDNTLSAQVYNPESGEMEDNELLTELFAQYQEECDIYPSIKMTTALYGGKLYFNLSNCILSYDLESGNVEKVKEYNTVYATCDTTVAFRGMAYSVTDEATDMKVTNHPIAALTIKDDGQMYVSIATNFAFISGKDGVNDTDHYGYAYEESNYNPNYSTFMQGTSSDSENSGFEDSGYSEETNDNDEFMWSAVFVDTISMKNQSSCDHSSTEKVTVEPFCGRDGYTEERCTSCGAPIDGTRVVDEGSALEHHYIHFEETYYTKDDDGNWNTGDCYVCTICGSAVEEPEEPGEQNAQESDEDYQERVEEYEKEKAEYDAIVESAGHTYEPTDAEWSEDSTTVTFSNLKCSSVCEEKHSKLDCLLNDETISVACKETTAEAEVTGYEGECTTGVTAVYTAEGETEDGYKYTASNKVEQEAGEHSYVADFVWEEAEDEEAEIPYTVTATEVKCEVCGAKAEGTLEVTVELNKEKSFAPTCEEDGKNVYTATATVTDDDGKVIATVTEDKSEESDVLPAIGHDYKGEFTWKEITDDEGNITGYTATADITCANDCGSTFEDVEATVELDKEKSVQATCKAEGKDVYVATAVVKGEDDEEIAKVTDEKEVVIPADKHLYEGEFTWNKVTNVSEPEKVTYTATADLTCPDCGDKREGVTAEVTYDEENSFAPTCEEDGKDIYVAVATAKDDDGKELGSATDTLEIKLDATGHDWDEGVITWTEITDDEGKGTGEFTATATVTCKNECGTVYKDVEAKVEKDEEASVAPTCEEGGKNVFNATAVIETKDGKEITVTDTKEVELDATGHDWDEGVVTWTAITDVEGNVTGYTATATVTCKNECGTVYKDVEAEVELDKEESVAPTCEEGGKNVYNATAVIETKDGKKITVTDTKTDTLPANGHNYEDGYCTVCGAQEPSIEAPAIVSVYSKVQTSVKVTWSAVDNAQGYELWRATSIDAAEDEWVRAKTVKDDDIEKYTNSDGDIQYTNQDLKVGQTYYYKVRAFKMQSGETDSSNEEARIYSDFSSVDYMPAAVVFDNVYSNATFRIRILWNEVDGSHGYQIWRKDAGADDDTYKVVKTLGDRDNTLTDNQGATTAYSNTDLEAGKQYTYKMRAFYIPEEGKKIFGAYSDEITVAVMPEATTLSVSSSKAGRAVLSWKKVSGAAGYQVCMATSKNGSYSIVKSITDASTTSYTKYDLKSGSTYYFKVRAYVEVDGKKTFGDYTDVVSVKVK